MFESQEFLPQSVIARLTEKRVHDPDFTFRIAKERVRRERLAPAGRLHLVAADHLACRVCDVGDEPLGMADRRDYLARILRALMSDAVDGVVATMDVLEDLLCIDGFLRSKRRPLLDGKLLIASLNRSGLAGASWEISDAITGPTPATCAYWYLDAVKMLLRIADSDSGSHKTMIECSQAIAQANSLRLPTILEVLPVVRSEEGWSVVQTPRALAKAAGVASAIGDSSRYLWLNLPYCEGYETVARATTLPILVLGGEFVGHAEMYLHQLNTSLSGGANVRGVLAGRNILYPGQEDPLAVATAAGRIVHGHWPVAQALQALENHSRPDMDRITKYL